MFDPDAELPSADYLLRANAIMSGIAAGASEISDLAFATALPPTTIIRTVAILVDEQVLEVRQNGSALHFSIKQRMRHP